VSSACNNFTLTPKQFLLLCLHDASFCFNSYPDKQGSTYHYQFQHRQSFLVGYPEWVNASHMDDIYSFLGKPFFERYRRLFLKQDFDDTDTTISNYLISYFSNFAYTRFDAHNNLRNFVSRVLISLRLSELFSYGLRCDSL
jgi:hypothetical protein